VPYRARQGGSACQEEAEGRQYSTGRGGGGQYRTRTRQCGSNGVLIMNKEETVCYEQDK
jgi:hypothetical protein